MEFAAMCALRQAPGSRNTDRAFCQGAQRQMDGMSEVNKKNYDLLAQFVYEQGMTSRRMTLQDLFAKEAFELDLPLPLIHPVEYDF